MIISRFEKETSYAFRPSLLIFYFIAILAQSIYAFSYLSGFSVLTVLGLILMGAYVYGVTLRFQVSVPTTNVFSGLFTRQAKPLFVSGLSLDSSEAFVAPKVAPTGEPLMVLSDSIVTGNTLAQIPEIARGTK